MRPGDFLRTNMLFAGDAEIGSTLDRGVVGDHHAQTPADLTHAGHHAGPGRDTLVHVGTGQVRQLQKRGAWIQQRVDAIAHEQLASLTVTGQRGRATTFACQRPPSCQIGQQHPVGGVIQIGIGC